jgi:hypothetical protein
MTADDRDERVAALLDELFGAASRGAPRVSHEIADELDVLFATTVWGFRELVLTVAIARILDPEYSPSTGLYACHPRALYEGPIRDFFDEPFRTRSRRRSMWRRRQSG